MWCGGGSGGIGIVKGDRYLGSQQKLPVVSRYDILRPFAIQSAMIKVGMELAA